MHEPSCWEKLEKWVVCPEHWKMFVSVYAPTVPVKVPAIPKVTLVLVGVLVLI